MPGYVCLACPVASVQLRKTTTPHYLRLSDHVQVRVFCVCNLRAKADDNSQQGVEADVLISITAQQKQNGLMLVRVSWLRWLVGGNGDGTRDLPLPSRSDIFTNTWW